MIAELLATACAGIFAGAAIYINVAQHPAALELGTATAVRFFSPVYRRAALMQAGLAIVGSLASLPAWWSSSCTWWLIGGALLAAVVPFTLLVIMPVNDRLKSPALDPGSPEAAELLARWGRLHGVRSIASLLAFLVFLTADR